MHFSGFLCKAYSKVYYGHAEILHTILGQSLLLSTTILNDSVIHGPAEVLWLLGMAMTVPRFRLSHHVTLMNDISK